MKTKIKVSSEKFDRKKKIEKNRQKLRRKAKMYSTIVKKVESGEYKSQAEDKYENLYQDFKTWRQAKRPESLKIHMGSSTPIHSSLVSEFWQSRVAVPKFDPNSPQSYYQKLYAGGPKSNIIKTQSIEPDKYEKCVRSIQKWFR